MKRRGVIALFAAAPLMACGFRPLYGPAGETEAELSSVSIPEPQTRLGQVLRNELLSAMRPAGRAGADKYVLLLVPSLQEDSTIVDPSRGVIRRTAKLTVAYTLTELGGAKALASGRTFSMSAYDITGESFADKRAKEAAAERTAKDAAQDILGRVSGYFAGKRA